MSVVVPGSGGQRYVKMFGRSTSCLLAPSEINYSYPMNGEQAGLQGLTTEQEDTIAASLLLYRLPKMQVTEKGGRWFALNNASLRLFRRLEYEGKCSKVSAEVVPLSKVPPKVREAMANAPLLEGRNGVQPSPALTPSRLSTRNQIAGAKSKFRDKIGNKGEEDEEEETGQTTKKGYHKIGKHLDDEDNDDTASSRNGDDDVTSSSCTEDDDEDSQDLENLGEIVDDDSETDFQDDELTCNVCDRTFSSGRQMARHQQRRRHFWCSVCETLFPALTALERHKQNLDHWSDEEEEEEEDEGDEDDEDEEENEEDEGKETTKVGGEEVTSEEDETSPDSTVRRKSGEQERLL